MGIQFNSNDAKAFRATVEKYYNAKHAIADLANRRNDEIKRHKMGLDLNNDDLMAIEKGEYVGKKTRESIEKENAVLRDKIAELRKDYDDAKAEQDKRTKKALELYTDAMHKGAQKAISTFGDMSEWRKALSDMLIANGLKDATPDNCAQFDFLVVVRTNNSKKVYKDNCLVGVGTKAQSANTFVSTIAEYLVSQKCVNPFKHKYVPLSEREKDKKNK